MQSWIDREMKTHQSLTSSPSKGVKSETQAPWCPKLYPFSFHHLLKLFIHSLHHLKSIPLCCCYPSSVPELRVISTERMEHLFLIFLPKKNTFFPNESALGKHIFQICAEMANVLAALTGPCTVWPSLPLTPSGAHHSLPHVVPVILASVSF